MTNEHSIHVPRAQRAGTTTDFVPSAIGAVVVGGSLPAHDEVFDLSEEVARTLNRLHAYVTSVRSSEQADDAVAELLTHLAATTTTTESRTA